MWPCLSSNDVEGREDIEVLLLLHCTWKPPGIQDIVTQSRGGTNTWRIIMGMMWRLGQCMVVRL
eukprot:12918120-Prorocentrum_lima.AAC.1